MRRVLWVLGAMLAVVSLRADKKPVQTTRYEDKNLNYSFQPPKDWLRVESLPSPIVAYKAPMKTGFATNFSVNLHGVQVDPKKETAFLEETKKAYQKEGTMTPIKQITLGGKPAFTWRVTLKLASAKGLEMRQVLCFYKRRAYELTFTLPIAQRKTYDPMCDKILNSFQFTK